MANLNKVMLIGRLTRDPETRTFANGGKVAKFGFAVNNRKKNASTGQWEDDPVFLDIDAFNWGEKRKLADLVEQYLRKGHQAYVEGSLVLDQWTDKEGQKRQKIKVLMDNVQFLEPKSEGRMNDGGGARSSRAPSPPMGTMSSPPMDEGYNAPEPVMAPTNSGNDEDIPF